MNKRIHVLIPPNTQRKLETLKQKHGLNQSQTIRTGIDLVYEKYEETR